MPFHPLTNFEIKIYFQIDALLSSKNEPALTQRGKGFMVFIQK